MKKFFLMALAASAMMSCTESEMLDNGGQQAEIKVGTMVKAGTKAAVTDNDNFTAFTVSAYAMESNAAINDGGLGTAYMDKVSYTGKQGSWKPVDESTYYWPLGKTMEFFAYPTDLAAKYSADANGYPTLGFTVEAAATDQTDLVVAYKEEKTMPVDGKLMLTFKHILARINFSYKPEDANYIYEVTGITINGVSGGTATYTYNAGSGSWSAGDNAAANYTYPITVAATPAADGFYALDSENGSLMLLPQSVAGKTISVTYKTTKGGYTYFNDTKDVTLPAGAEWGVGQNIRYKLTLPVGAAKITVDTDVENINEAEIPGVTE